MQSPSFREGATLAGAWFDENASFTEVEAAGEFDLEGSRLGEAIAMSGAQVVVLRVDL